MHYFKRYPRWYRRPRTTQERRATQKHSKWGRRGRNMKNLPNAYDDIGVKYTKSWKAFRNNQYYEGGRGEVHIIYLEAQSWCSWSWIYKDPERKLRDFLYEHKIPYKVETIREGYLYWASWHPTPQWKHSSTIVGYKITYWSKKDLSKALTFLGIGV